MSSTALPGTSPQIWPRFAGKTVLVTGAGTGFGAEIAFRAAQEGAKVAVHYRSSRAGAEATVARIEAIGGEAVGVAGGAAGVFRLHPFGLEQAAFMQPDQDGVERSGAQMGKLRQVIAMAPLERVGQKRVQDQTRLGRRCAKPHAA